MPGTKAGGIKARDKNIKQYGADFYNRIGRIGGRNSKNGGFASDKVGADGLTGRQRARIAGQKGGRVSTRKGVLNGQGQKWKKQDGRDREDAQS